MSAPSENRRRPDAARASRRGGVIDAPRDDAPRDDAPRDDVPSEPDSPLPSAATTSTTVRPPAPKGRVAGPLGRAVQLVAGAVIVLASSVGVAWGARRYLTQSPRFAVRTVLVDGAHRRSAAQVAAGGGVAVGDNIFALDLARAGAMITQDPWIEKATVTRRLPSTISIAVVEREAAALAVIGGELYVATRDGDLFKKLGADDPGDLPVITGILPAQVQGDRRGVVMAVKRVLDVAEEAEQRGIARRYPIQELHLEKDGSLVVTIGREAIALALGQPPYRDKVEEASRILNEVARRKASAQVIFLDNDAHPERVVVRMR